MHELKTVNRRATVAVKIPVTPEVGIIAVGIVKSGADVVTLSGYDGGTGAARQHALRRAGLPVEIGVAEAHRALVAAGLRERVEIWCDGGMKSALDAAKMLCLGADRVGFGTFAMVAIGCTICRGCQLDTCHVGIATQIESAAEAVARGLKRFEPQEEERAVANLVRAFGAMREELGRIAARLGVASVRDLVGRTDLLVQARGLQRVDLRELIAPVGVPVMAAGPAAARAPRALRAGLPVQSVPPLALSGGVPSTPSRARPPLAASPAAVDGSQLSALDRFVGTGGSGDIARARIFGGEVPELRMTYGGGSVAGNGAAAYATDGLALTIAGGAQDGAAKTALGGTVAILKARNAEGRYVDGSVGKCFAYGAQRGRFVVQGSADARAGIRLSGADVVIGGDVRGFAFEYMTGGRAVVLGDPGRWICSGMSGGVVFLRHDPAGGLDEAALRDRLAKGAKVGMRGVTESDRPALDELLRGYADALRAGGQADAADAALALLDDLDAFRGVRPAGELVDQTISTE